MRTLQETKKTLPAHWYFDPNHYERELRAIWYQDWVCVGRMESLPRDGAWIAATIGTQKIVITRIAEGRLHAFHNTCRHRGAELCQDNHGQFRNGRIICPYHTWTYGLDGKLLATPFRFESSDFDADRYALHSVHVDVWGGFIFVNLAISPASGLMDFLGVEAENLRNWPLAEMRSVQQEIIPLACNWKIFWENFNECYHCPRVHPELCKVMPVYKHAVFDAVDLPDWQPQFEGDTGTGRVGAGASTWTLDGKTSLPIIEGLSEQDIAAGVKFASITGSMYVVAHPDYVRSVRIVPTGPESISLTVDWLLPETTACSAQELERISALVRVVLQQDGAVCEANQRGVHSLAYTEGVLVPQEFELWHFHELLRSRLQQYSGT